MAEDYYQTLGVERTSTPEEIKKAYRRLAHKYHPDKENGDEDKFKEVNSAYQVLSDDKKRSQYDQFGHTFDGSGGGSNPFGGRVDVDFEDMGGFGNVGDMFEQFFGGRGGGTRQASRGQDVSIDTSITFEESARGTTVKSSHRIYQSCEHCHGNAAEPGTPIKTCGKCGGQGAVSTTRQTMLGTFAQKAVCPDCAGEGKIAETPCRQCRGTGRELKTRQLSIDIPAGIADGQTVRLTGKGEAAAKGGVTGDLYVNVHVKPHTKWKREGDNITSAIAISYIDAILGASLTVETLDGTKDLTIPAGTQPNATFTMAGLGFPQINTSQRGDHIFTAKVKIPKRLSRHQKQLIKELRNAKPKRKLFS